MNDETKQALQELENYDVEHFYKIGRNFLLSLLVVLIAGFVLLVVLL